MLSVVHCLLLCLMSLNFVQQDLAPDTTLYGYFFSPHTIYIFLWPGNVSIGAEESVETITLSGDESFTTPSAFSLQSMSYSTPISITPRKSRKRSRLNTTSTPPATSSKNTHVLQQHNTESSTRAAPGESLLHYRSQFY